MTILVSMKLMIKKINKIMKINIIKLIKQIIMKLILKINHKYFTYIKEHNMYCNNKSILIFSEF